MQDAIIKDNKAYCPSCGLHKYKLFTSAYRLVNTKSNGKAVEYKCECLQCGTTFKYLRTLRIGLEKSFVDDDVKEIKEEKWLIN